MHHRSRCDRIRMQAAHRQTGELPMSRRSVLALMALFATPIAMACGPVVVRADPVWTQGKHYFVLQPAQHTSVPAGKVEVTEVFSYGCPYCDQFLPVANQLKASLPPNAVLDYLPASFSSAEDWPMFQRAFCTAQTLGIVDRTHAAMFDAVWRTGELGIADPKTGQLRRPLPTIEDAARFYQRKAGVPADRFLAAARSFAVEVRMKADDALVIAYQVDRTPTIIVNGKYRVNLQSAGGANELIDLVRWLVAQETR
jgi:thiol:disulfide interchange protein DsbA